LFGFGSFGQGTGSRVQGNQLRQGALGIAVPALEVWFCGRVPD
jgi:hypothetical protein